MLKIARGQALRQARKTAGFKSAASLAQRARREAPAHMAGVFTAGLIYRFENGTQLLISEHAAVLADVLSVGVEELLVDDASVFDRTAPSAQTPTWDELFIQGKRCGAARAWLDVLADFGEALLELATEMGRETEPGGNRRWHPAALDLLVGRLAFVGRRLAADAGDGLTRQVRFSMLIQHVESLVQLLEFAGSRLGDEAQTGRLEPLTRLQSARVKIIESVAVLQELCERCGNSPEDLARDPLAGPRSNGSGERGGLADAWRSEYDQLCDRFARRQLLRTFDELARELDVLVRAASSATGSPGQRETAGRWKALCGDGWRVCALAQCVAFRLAEVVADIPAPPRPDQSDQADQSDRPVALGDEDVLRETKPLRQFIARAEQVLRAETRKPGKLVGELAALCRQARRDLRPVMGFARRTL